MWKIEDFAFFARSPRLYISTPQATEQYGQVLRVSVARASLNSRTSARACCGLNPRTARLDAASVAPETLRKSRRVRVVIAPPLARDRSSVGPRCGERQVAHSFKTSPGYRRARV